MRIVVGCNLEEFKRYYKTLRDLHNYYTILGLQDVNVGELGDTEKQWVMKDPTHLLVLRRADEIVGHAIWHETNTEEHRKGDRRDKEDRAVLRRLLGGRRDKVVELHEIWLRKKHRGKGFGKQFFQFFEKFIRNKGYDSIVYYTDNLAAIAICRERGWKEDFLARENWHVFGFC